MPAPARLITHNGRTQGLEAWARETGIPMSTLKSRLDRLGWPPDRALTTPIDRRFRRGGRYPAGVLRPVPKLHERADGMAYAEWTAFGRRRKVYFGKFGSEEARVAYRRFAAEWAQGDPVPSGEGPPSVAGLILRFVEHAERTYRKRGKRTSEVYCVRAALAVVNDLYGDTEASEFTPMKLMAVRDAMLEKGWTRKTINDHVQRVARCWSWGVVRGLVPVTVADALGHLESLSAGRTEAPESKPKKPVKDRHVEAVIPHLHANEQRRAVLEGMIRFQVLTGMRPGELTSMRPDDLKPVGSLLRYEPADGGKTLHLDKKRVIWIGPKAQAILLPFRETEKWGEPIFRFPPWRRGADWSVIGVKRYRDSIDRACQIAGIPVWTPHQLRHTRATDVMRIYESDEAVGIAIGDSPEVARQIYADNPEEAVAKRIASETG